MKLHTSIEDFNWDREGCGECTACTSGATIAQASQRLCSTDAGKLYFKSMRTYWQERIDLHEDDDDSDIPTALRNAFKRLDNYISLEAQVDFGVPFARFTPLRVALSGCTACVAHVDWEDLHVANLGDSRAVLGVQGDDGRWSALSVTNDHNAHNPDEMQQVLSEHPASKRKTVVKHDRLLGLLIPFRGFGVMKFKWSGELLNRTYEARPELLIGNENAKNLLPDYHTPPYLIADPETTYHKLRPQDKFLILATDGLWELMHRQTVVQVLGEHLSDMQWKKPVSGLCFTVGQMHGLLQERKSRALSALVNEKCYSSDPSRSGQWLRWNQAHSQNAQAAIGFGKDVQRWHNYSHSL